MKDLEARLVREAEDASRLRQSHGTLTVEHTRLKACTPAYAQLCMHWLAGLPMCDVVDHPRRQRLLSIACCLILG